MSNEFKSGLSRRSFMRSLGAASVAAASLPAFAGVQGGVAPQNGRAGMNIGDMSGLGGWTPDNVVVISMNENPLGPAQCALDAICKTAMGGNRYRGDIIQKTVATATDLFGLKRGYVGLFPGSAGPLNLALASNIGPDRPLVHGDPSYEQGPSVADMLGVPRFAVPLTPTHAHDVRAMVAASPKAGAYYIVNPNNPTGTITPKADIVWLLKNKPAGSVVIVDEAYHHFSNEESSIDLVAAGEDIIVTRTFSKIYGMAGLRAGLVFARPEYFQKFRADLDLCAKPREHLDHQRGRRQCGIAGQGPGATAAQDQRGQPRCDAGVSDQARLHDCSRLADQLLHGRRQATGRRVSKFDARGEYRHWAHLARAADVCAHHCRQQGRDGEIPDCVRQVHGQAMRPGERSHAALPSGAESERTASRRVFFRVARCPPRWRSPC